MGSPVTTAQAPATTTPSWATPATCVRLGTRTRLRHSSRRPTLLASLARSSITSSTSIVNAVFNGNRVLLLLDISDFERANEGGYANEEEVKTAPQVQEDQQHVLAFFAASDGIVNENLVERF